MNINIEYLENEVKSFIARNSKIPEEIYMSCSDFEWLANEIQNKLSLHITKESDNYFMGIKIVILDHLEPGRIYYKKTNY